MMMALLHSNGQLRTERDGDTERGCQKPAVQQKTIDDDENTQFLLSLNHNTVLPGITWKISCNPEPTVTLTIKLRDSHLHQIF